MTLLQQIIQEYLNEHHPEWKVRDDRPICIAKIIYRDQFQQPARSSIWILHETIEYYSSSIQYVELPYTLENILPQITRAIKNTKAHNYDIAITSQPRVSE